MVRKVDEDLYLEEGDEMKFDDAGEVEGLEEKRSRAPSKKVVKDEDKDIGEEAEDIEEIDDSEEEEVY